MNEYVRAAARVHAGLLALQAVPDTLRASYSDEFTRELYNARTIRKKHGLPRMRYISELTKMIAERCKPPGAYGLLPAAFAREVGKVALEPDVRYEGELGEFQWWTELQTHQWYIELDAMNTASDSEAEDDELNTPPSSSPTDKLHIVDPEAGSCRLRPVDLTAPEEEEPKQAPEPNLYPLRLASPEREEDEDEVMETEAPAEAPKEDAAPRELLPPVQLSTPPLIVSKLDDEDEDLLLIFPEDDSAPVSCAPSRIRTPQLPTPPPSSAASFGNTTSPSPQPTHKEPESVTAPSHAPSHTSVSTPGSPIPVPSRGASPVMSDMALETPPDSPPAPVTTTPSTPARCRKRSASVAGLDNDANEKQKTLKLEAMESVLGPLPQSPAKPSSSSSVGRRVTLTASIPSPSSAPVPAPAPTAVVATAPKAQTPVVPAATLPTTPLAAVPTTPSKPTSLPQKPAPTPPVPVYYAQTSSSPPSAVAGPSRLPANIPARPQPQVPVYRSPELPQRPEFIPGPGAASHQLPQRVASSSSSVPVQNASEGALPVPVHPAPSTSSQPPAASTSASASPASSNKPPSPTIIDLSEDAPVRDFGGTEPPKLGKRARKTLRKRKAEEEAVQQQQDVTRQTMLDLSAAIAAASIRKGYTSSLLGGNGGPPMFVTAVTSLGAATSTAGSAEASSDAPKVAANTPTGTATSSVKSVGGEAEVVKKTMVLPPKALPTGPKADIRLPTGPKAHAALPTGPRAGVAPAPFVMASSVTGKPIPTGPKAAAIPTGPKVAATPTGPKAVVPTTPSKSATPPTGPRPTAMSSSPASAPPMQRRVILKLPETPKPSPTKPPSTASSTASTPPTQRKIILKIPATSNANSPSVAPAAKPAPVPAAKPVPAPAPATPVYTAPGPENLDPDVSMDLFGSASTPKDAYRRASFSSDAHRPPSPPRKLSYNRPEGSTFSTRQGDFYRPDESSSASGSGRQGDSYRPDEGGSASGYGRQGDSYRPAASSSSNGWTGDSYRPDEGGDAYRPAASSSGGVPVYSATASSSSVPSPLPLQRPTKAIDKPVCMADVQHLSCRLPLTPRALIAHMARAHGWDALRSHAAADYICAGGGPGGMGVEREEFEKRVWDVVDGRVDLSEEGRRRKAQGDSWRPAVAAHPTPAYMTSGDSYRPGDLAVVDDGPPVCMADARDRLPECARLPPGAGTVWAHMTRAHGWSALTKPGAREFICNNAPKRKEFERRVWDVIDEKVDLGPAEVVVKRERIESVFLGGEDEGPVCMADPSDRRDTCSQYMTPREVWAHMLSAHRWDALRPPAVAEYVCGGDTTHSWVSRGLFESRVREVMNGYVVRPSNGSVRRGRDRLGRQGGHGLMAESMGGAGYDY
ncbi:unnamed protein product [Peniophora sp. CBMAI 1063]|nr:unnamed protein product [Peniophora sp. CBMAI 1063]